MSNLLEFNNWWYLFCNEVMRLGYCNPEQLTSEPFKEEYNEGKDPKDAAFDFINTFKKQS